MEQYCARCGHTLVVGTGRFCVNCGHPVGQAAPDDDWRTSTAERPATSPPTELAAPTEVAPPAGPAGPVVPAAPPPAYTTPPKARYPLFADEPPAPAAEPAVPAWEAPPPVYGDGEPTSHRARSTLPWVVVALVLLLVAGLGGFLLVRGGDDDGPSAGGPTASDSDSPTDAGSDEPDDQSSPPDPGDDEPADDEPRDVATGAQATASETASPSRDVNGNAVRYEASNMVDGQADTAWRMPGAGVGAELTFDLGGTVTIDEVGLINGYTKQDPGYDGYPANRRITQVQWVFDDGTTVDQTLVDGVRDLQTVDTGGVDAASVVLRILAVTKPAKGPAGRNYTAISEVSLVGVPAS